MKWSRLLRCAGLLFGLSLSAGCGSIHTEARVPEPNVLGRKKSGGSCKLDVSLVPESEICSRQGGLKDFCVARCRSAISGGLEKVFSVYIDQAKPGPSYSARFKLLQFSHSVTSGGSASAGGPTVKLTLRWQFEMFDGAGNAVLQLAETTDGPEQFNNVKSADNVLGALLSAVMEKIAASIKDAPLLPDSGAAAGAHSAAKLVETSS
ncbi:MAG: hypothetical protein QM756_36350 [Polyangiaceae bacterium]